MAEKKKEETQLAPAYPVSELKANSKALFNCNPEVISGAVSGLVKTEFTVDEMHGLIQKYMQRKVGSK